jgi:hypothetical protein
MLSGSTTRILMIQGAASLILFAGIAHADGPSCENVGERRCNSCYMLDLGVMHAAVDGQRCTDMGEEGKAWVYQRTFKSDESPLLTAGCADAREQCEEWMGEGGDH